MKFHLALRIAAHAAYHSGQITAEQRSQILDTCNQFGTGRCICGSLEDSVTQAAVDAGVVQDGVRGKIDWASILDFLKGLMPLILQLIAIFSPPKP